MNNVRYEERVSDVTHSVSNAMRPIFKCRLNMIPRDVDRTRIMESQVSDRCLSIRHTKKNILIKPKVVGSRKSPIPGFCKRLMVGIFPMSVEEFGDKPQSRR